ncbi:hypothetical protein [Hymenobacter sp. BT559]|uniref:hypothetical protein n=1 Tax=Hymenobacter sp. BT559 TaxID=2795729 RepID=UPI0018EADD9D|nr:hypothetical protein [Hymenobacter sp. BT559]MBJ6146145.1 hypothetical protein [Hymenobacter sp. BT559]
MELSSKDVVALMREKGVEYLYHANTVRTTCTFFRTGHLLARGSVHERSLDQTTQPSDRLDRKLGIWYDLFFDSCDIHARSSNYNKYGPVLLCFDLSLLEQDWAPTVWMTKDNPIRWSTDTPSNERWFNSFEELQTRYDRYAFQQHCVLRNVGGSVRMLPYLKKIVLDNPKRARPNAASVDRFSEAVGALNNALRAGGLFEKGITFNNRPCTCGCVSSYASMTEEKLDKLFGS